LVERGRRILPTPQRQASLVWPSNTQIRAGLSLTGGLPR
jgi:hypothetical protein